MRRLRGGVVLVGFVLASAIGVPASAASPAPSASPDPQAATWVTGTIALAPGCSGPDTTVGEGVRHERGYVCQPQVWTLSDPRLSGRVVSTWNADVYTTTRGVVSVAVGTYEIANDGGSWICRYGDALQDGSGIYSTPINDETLTCAGQGGYEGLTAILAGDWSAPPITTQGLILSGPLPPTP